MSFNGTVAGDFIAAETVGDTITQRLEVGDTPTGILSDIRGQLAESPHVAAAILSDDAQSLMLVCTSGLQYEYQVQVLDEDFTSVDFFTEDEPAEAAGIVIPPATPKYVEGYSFFPPAAAGIDEPPYVLPTSNRALVANAITACQPITGSSRDATKGVAKYLQKTGYQVDRRTADVALFSTLSSYDIIFIEARGSQITGTEYIDALTNLSAPGQNDTPNSGASGGTHALTTSTVANAATVQQYADDIRLGRVKIRTPWYTQRGKVVRCGSYLAVTANFVRQYDTGRFRNNSLLYISAGNQVDTTALQSDWHDMFKQRCDHGQFITWYGSPSYPVMMLATANLFELLTGAENKYSIKTTSTTIPGGENLTDIEVNSDIVQPPLMNASLSNAVTTLGINGDSVDLGTGAFLWYQTHGYEDGLLQWAAAPVFDDLRLDQAGSALVIGGTVSGGQLRFTQAGVGGVGLPLSGYGFRGPDVIGEVGIGYGYHATIPVGLAGPAVLTHPDGRTSTARQVYTWKPVFTITGSGANGMTFTATYTMVVRGVIGPRARTGTNPLTDPYAPPRINSILARFDGTASTVSWSVTGTSTQGQYRYQHNGSGLANISFKKDNGDLTDAVFVSEDGQTVEIDIEPVNALTYTETITDLTTGINSSSDKTLPAFLLYVAAAALGDDHTVATGHYTITGSSPQDPSYTVSWPAFSPTPLFRPQWDRR